MCSQGRMPISEVWEKSVFVNAHELLCRPAHQCTHRSRLSSHFCSVLRGRKVLVLPLQFMRRCNTLVTLSLVIGFAPTLRQVSLLAWTTTPWTLPSNLALCVNKGFDYVKLRYNETDGWGLFVHLLVKGRAWSNDMLCFAPIIACPTLKI